MEPDPLSRMHSAEHLLNATMVRLFGSNRCFSAHINKKKSKCDYVFQRNLTSQEIDQLETMVNQAIHSNLEVNEEFISRQEAAVRYDLNRLPDSAGDEVRIIKMGDYDAVPCSGDHVKRTGQIGTLKITTSSFEDSVLRLRFKLLDPVKKKMGSGLSF